MILRAVVPRTMESSITTTRLAFDDFPHRVELDLDPEVADRLLRFDEGAPDVVVADQPELEGDSRLLGIADGGGDTRIGNRNDHVGLDGMLAGEVPAEFLAHPVDLSAEDGAVGTGKVDVFEDTGGRGHRAEGMKGLQPVLVDEDHLPRLDFADELGLDEIEGAGLGGDDVGAVEPAKSQGAETVGVAHGDHPGLGEKYQAVGSLDGLQGLSHPIGKEIALSVGEQVNDDFGVGRWWKKSTRDAPDRCGPPGH